MLGCLGFIVWAKLFQNPAVLPELVIYIPHQVMGIGIEAVVKAVAAHVATKLFVDPPHQGFAAFLAIVHVFSVWPEHLTPRQCA